MFRRGIVHEDLVLVSEYVVVDVKLERIVTLKNYKKTQYEVCI